MKARPVREVNPDSFATAGRDSFERAYPNLAAKQKHHLTMVRNSHVNVRLFDLYKKLSVKMMNFLKAMLQLSRIASSCLLHVKDEKFNVACELILNSYGFSGTVQPCAGFRS